MIGIKGIFFYIKKIISPPFPGRKIIFKERDKKYYVFKITRLEIVFLISLSLAQKLLLFKDGEVS